MEHLALFPVKEEQTKDKKIKALDELFQRSSIYKNSDKYLELIQFIKKFPDLSPFNAFLVYTQNPGVQFVMQERKWLRYGRKVIPNARPLVILVPFGPVEFVYDIKDTEGEKSLDEIMDPYATKGKFDDIIYYQTKKNSDKEKIIVAEREIANATAGYARNRKNHFEITVNNTWDIKVKYSTLIHELGHIFSGHLGTIRDSWWRDRINNKNDVMEIEAESISYLVCKRAGLETSSESYLSDYIKNRNEMPPVSLDTILTVSGYIEQMSSGTFTPKKPSKVK